MKTFLDCIPCMVRQTLDAVRFATTDEQAHETILREVLETVARMDYCQTPPAMAQRIHRRIRELTGQPDPYREAKEQLNVMAWDLIPAFEQRIGSDRDPLELAVRLAIAGNLMDLGVKTHPNEAHIRSTIENCETEPFDGDIAQFRRAIDEARSILYLTDNAGEIVFDRLLVERLPRDKVTVAVKGGPVINDATMRDAEAARLTDLVEVIDNGSDAPGTIVDDCSDTFRARFARADMVIAKGQGNYETLAGSASPIFFLLRVKCPVIARDIGCPVGTMVLRASHLGSH